MWGGVALLALPVAYAGLLGWLRGGWQRNLTPLTPLSLGEGGTSFSLSSSKGEDLKL